MARITTYQDLFPSSTIMRQSANNGTITIPGSADARLYAPNSNNCQFHYTSVAGPLLYERLSTMWQSAHPAQPLFIEAKLSVFTGTTTLRIAGISIFTTPVLTPLVPFYSYQMGWFKSDAKIHVWVDVPTWEGEIVTAVTAADPASTAHIYRMYWNPYNRPMWINEVSVSLPTDYLCFAYSVDNGVTWVNMGTRLRDFDFDQAFAGIYVRKWETTAVNAQADFAYFRAQEWGGSDSKYVSPDAYGRNQKRAGFEDAGAPINESSGPARFDSPDGIKDSITLLDGEPRAGFDDTYVFPAVAGRDVRFDSPDGLKEEYPLPRDRAGFEESLFVQLDNTDYIKAKYDADGREYLGNYGVRHIQLYDATADPWHTHGAGFYGAGRDGVFYYDGVACGPGSFGTLADGRRKTAWGTVGDFVDPVFTVAPTITADAEIQCALVAQAGTNGVSTRLRWSLIGDFDIQVDYEILLNGSGPSDQGITLHAFMDSNNYVYVRRRMWGSGSPNYDRDVKNNGSWVSYVSVGTVHTSGKLRLTRVGSTVSTFFWSGSAWTQIGSGYAMTYNRPMAVDVQLQTTTPVTATVKLRNFTVNSGATTNLVGWAREAAGTYRGSQAAFPQHALIVSSGNSLDIIDADTNKLWMSFRSGTNQLLGGDANYYLNQTVMRDGVLFAAYRTLDTAVLDGWGGWIDFTLDFMRMHRGPTYGDAGFTYNVELTTGVSPRDSPNGAISWRNSARAFFSWHFDNWQCQNMRVNWVDLLHYGGYQYRLIANNGGVYLCQWQRWKFEGTGNANLNTPYYGIGTQTVATRWAMFRPTSKDVLCHDRIKLWVTHYSNWSTVMGGGGGTWLEDHAYTLAGTVDAATVGALAQDSMTLDDAAGLLFYARNEGVYVMDLATGTSVLFYGKVGSGATHESLPDYATISSVKLTTDSGTAILLVGMARPDRIWAVNRATHAIYWSGFQDDAHQPLSMAVGA